MFFIATVNDAAKLSEPLLDRFIQIDIPPNFTLSSLSGLTLTGSAGTSCSFERWTDWSQWKDTIVEASCTRQETRTVYRYIPA